MSRESELLKSLFHIKKMLFAQISKGFISQGLTPIEVMVLYRLKHGAENEKISELAKEMGIPASTFTGIMDRLVEKDFVQRERGKEDRRIVTIKVKEKIHPPVDDGNPVTQYLQQVLEETEPGFAEDLLQKLKYLENILAEKKVK